MTITTLRRLAAAATLTVSLGACGNDSTGTPTGTTGLDGTYTATTFTITTSSSSGSSAKDVLAAGGSLTMSLESSGASSGVTTGRVVVPASAGGPLDASLAGTFTRTGNNIVFTQGADTFVRDLTWIVVGTQLQGSGTFSSTTVNVVLTKG